MTDKLSPLSGDNSPFEGIRHTNEFGMEYWSARELLKILDYNEYRKFKPVIERAIEACENSGQAVFDHFAQTDDMIEIGKGARRKVEDYHLSRYACYLIVQNADPAKEMVALGQTYFAIQTRRKELTDQQQEEYKRLYLRGEMKRHNTNLSAAAQDAGVISPMDFAIFHNYGYQGLYGGLGAKQLAQSRGLKKASDLLDHMGSTELAANLFRATQTEEKLRREKIRGKANANNAHYFVGRKVRQTIKDLGGTMPEQLALAEDIKKIERKKKKNGEITSTSLIEE